MSSHTVHPSTEETTPLLDSENPSFRGATTDAEAAERNERPSTVYSSLSRIDKILARLFVVVLATSVVQLGFTLAAILMTQYGSSRYNIWDFELDQTLGYFFWTTIFGIIVALSDFVLLRRKGRPGYAIINVLAFGTGAVVLVCTAGSAIVDKAWRLGGDPCEAEYDSYRRCLQWAGKYMVVMWFYLVVALILGLEYLTLFVAFLVREYEERSQSPPSSTTWSIPAGFVAFEVRVKWGNPQSERSSSGNDVASATAPTTQDE